jgi:thiamine-phosphate diphosphorylase
VDRRIGGSDLPARVAEAIRAGVDWVQLRERELEGAALLAFAEEMAAAARDAAAKAARTVRILVNRRVDVALALGADGVHLGFDAMDVATARRLLPADARIGVSTHSVAEVRAATDADYVHLAPIFPPLSKSSSRPPLGCDAIADAARAGVPVIAQGGIDANNAAAVRAAGAFGIAVTGAILAAEDITAATTEIHRALHLQ